MKKVIIIGGGFAGSYAAMKLEQKFKVTLIDNKNYFEFTPSILRTLVDSNHAKKIQIKHSQYLKKTNLIFNEVSNISDKLVETKKGRKYLYDYLIIASGSSYNRPIKEKNLVLADRTEELIESTEQLREANSVLIIGGGLVGVELAGEIVETFPKKKITLVQSNSEVIPRNHLKTRKQCKKYLESKGVEIIFNCKAKPLGNGGYLINTEKRKYDLSFSCVGINPNSDFIDSKLLDSRGFVKVNDHMQIIGKKNVFAIGDVNNEKEEKTAQVAEVQAKIAVQNIFNLEKGDSFVEYKHKETPLVISLGKKHGVFTYKNFSYFGIFPGLLKRIIEFKAMRR
jgi:apoptosis-inducing factor 2